MERSTSFFAATTVVATVVAIYLWQELRTERARNLESGAGVQLATLQPVTRSTAPSTREDGVGPALQQPALAGAPSADAEDSGEVVRRMCDSLKSRIRQSYGQLTPPQWLAGLQLTPDEQEQILDLQARRTGMISGMPECGDATRINALEFAAGMRELLGAARYEQFQDQQAASTAQVNMTTLRSQVANLGNPLTDEQAARLNEIILVEGRRSRQEATVRPASRDARDILDADEEELELTRRRFDRILAAARPLLEPAQFTQLETNMQRQLTQARNALDQQRKRVEAGGPQEGG